MKTAIYWFRQDLRLADNPALDAALQENERVILVYVHSPEEHGRWPYGAASCWWLHHSLQALESVINEKGGKLIYRQGHAVTEILDIASQTNAEALYCNRLYEPKLAERDARLQIALQRDGVRCHFYNGSLLFEPDVLKTNSGGPFKVFTPYWKKHQQLYQLSPPLVAPCRLAKTAAPLVGLVLEQLHLMPAVSWYQGIQQSWQPGETHALKALEHFAQSGVVNGYKTRRDYPAAPSTSRLSPYLRFGEISPRQILWRFAQLQASEPQCDLSSIETFNKELVWREFACNILYHFPQTTDAPLDQRFKNFPYVKNSKRLFEAWAQGRTGYPLVDAGMRELWHTGWMHNRVRMIVASFLTKNCLVSWKKGAAWFWDTLVDADLANNSFNWQWCAGCGADAAPYFRIFNPVTQSKKFDTHGHYVKKWLPELRALPEPYIHEPWKAPLEIQNQCGVTIGRHYPLPIVDLRHSRQQALDLYRQFIKSA